MSWPASLIPFPFAPRKSAAFVAICVLGLMCLTGCSSSGNSSSTGGSGGSSGGPTPSSSGLTIYPAAPSVSVGGEVAFTGYVPSQPNSTITWAVSGSSNGTITSGGVYTAPSSVPTPAQVAVTATSGNFSATAVVTVAAAQGVAVSPAAAAIAAGTQTTFTATMNGAPATGVTWEVNGTAGGDGVHGTINSSGVYSAPLSPPPGGSTVITAAAGGSSGTATATIVYSDASLSGNYSFSYTGDDGSGFLGIVGQFTANPNSGTISGTEDFLDAQKGPSTGQSISGTYSIGPDGRGSVDLSGTSGEVWQIALASNQHALLVNFNPGVATGSGTIDQQTSATPLAAGRYVFQLSGLNGSGSTTGIAGAFTSFGNGTLSPASSGNVIDINQAGSAVTDDTSLTGQFTATSLSLQSSVLTSLTGGTAKFDFYVVNARHLRLIETDGKAFTVGDVFAAPAVPSGGYLSKLLASGSYAFTMGGATKSPYAAGGVFVSDGGGTGTTTTGNITSGVFDNNNGGVHFQLNAALKASTFGVDSNTGRITSSFTTAASTLNWVGYVTSPTDPTQPNSVQVLMLEIDSNATASGLALLQSSTAQPSGTFGLNFTGQATGNSAGEQDVLAQLGINRTTLTGTLDINNFAAGKTQLGLNIQSSSSTIASPDGNGRGTMTIVAANGASFPVAYYAVDANTVLTIETDSQRVMIGVMLKQF
jgi:hypothetical protein